MRPILGTTWLNFFCLIALLGAACDASNENKAREALAPFEKDLGFEIVPPEYIPAGTDPVPYTFLLDENEIFYAFDPLAERNRPLAERPRVEVSQSPADENSVGTPPPTPDTASPLPSNRETLSFEGHDVVLFRNINSGGASMKMTVTSGGFDFAVTVIWVGEGVDDITAITPAMEEAWKILRSLLQS